MTDVTNTDDQLALEGLRAQCDIRGVKYHHKNGIERLQELLQEADEPKEEEKSASSGKVITQLDEVNAMRQECLVQRRVMITCNDPQKIAWKGEIFQAGNSVIGNIRKYCPFGNHNGWYMPQILLTSLEEKQFRLTNTKEHDPSSGGMAKAYNVTYLDNISTTELEALKTQQALRSAQQ